MSQPSTPPTDLPEQTAAHKAYQKNPIAIMRWPYLR